METNTVPTCTGVKAKNVLDPRPQGHASDGVPDPQLPDAGWLAGYTG